MSGPNITLKQLRALAATARHGSISAAADEVNLTPPAVHTQLKNLENTLELDLLDRTHSGHMELTEVGHILVEATQRMETELDTALRDIAAFRAGKTGRVRLGFVSTGKYFAPALVARLKNFHPNIDIRLRVGNRQEIISMLKGRVLDLAIMGRPPRDPKVVAEVIGPHPHVIIGRPDHPFVGLGHVPHDALLKETFIAREEGSGTRILMNRFLDEIGNGQLYATIEMDSNETIKQAVMAGLGIAIISEHTVIEELRSLRLSRIYTEGIPILRQWFLLHPEAVQLKPAAQAIRNTISGMSGSFLPHL